MLTTSQYFNESVSSKVSKTIGITTGLGLPGTGFVATQFSLYQLILAKYQLQRLQKLGGKPTQQEIKLNNISLTSALASAIPMYGAYRNFNISKIRYSLEKRANFLEAKQSNKSIKEIEQKQRKENKDHLLRTLKK